MDASADLNMQRLQTVKNQLLPTPYQASKSIYLIELGTIRYIKHEHIFSVHATPYPLFLLPPIPATLYPLFLLHPLILKPLCEICRLSLWPGVFPPTQLHS